MKKTILAAVLFAALSSVALVPAVAQASQAGLKAFPDFLSVRSQFLSALITANPVRALAFETAYRDTPFGRVRISVEREDESFYVLFLLERDGAFPYGSSGNVIIKREVKTGYVTQVVWHLADDGLSWVRLTPRNERTLVDYVVAGSLVRGGYPVSRLIYQFFTNTFGYLHDATRDGLDWSLVFGQPGLEAGAKLAADLASGRPSVAAVELLKAAADFTKVGRYLSAVGAPGSAPVEEVDLPYDKVVSAGDERSPVLSSAQPWKAERGLPIEAAPGLVVRGIADGSAYAAYVEGIRGEPPVSLAIVPYRDVDGSYVLLAVDAGTGRQVDFAALVLSRRGAWLRLFRLPVPGSVR